MQSEASARDSTASSRVHSVNATPGGLIKATLGAAIVAGAILIFAWLPAEYGIDPTGVGHVLGLTEMGHIKEQLHAEADADAAATEVTQNELSDLNASEVTLKLEAIQAQLSAIAASIDANAIAAENHAVAQRTEQPLPASQTDVTETPWRDEVDYTLDSGEGIEIKLIMQEGAVIEYEWSANGAVVNHDTHGDGNGQSISYEKGRSVPEQAGQLTAAFTGNHGWYWRNRTDDPVVVTLRTRGAYEEMVLP